MILGNTEHYSMQITCSSTIDNSEQQHIGHTSILYMYYVYYAMYMYIIYANLPWVIRSKVEFCKQISRTCWIKGTHVINYNVDEMMRIDYKAYYRDSDIYVHTCRCTYV